MPDDSTSVGDYYADGGLSVPAYDFVTELAGGNLAGDVDFYVDRIGARGPSVLELGAGTGRVSLALAERGFTVVGIDTSAAMLRLARAKAGEIAEAARRRVGFVLGDMTETALGRRFDGVIAPFYGFSHLIGIDRRRAALRRMAGHLSADGLCIVHAVSPATLSREFPIDERTRNAASVILDAAGSRLEVAMIGRAVDHDARTTTHIVEYAVVSPRGERLRTTRERLVYQWFSDDELRGLAGECGLEVTEIRDSFPGHPPGIERIYSLEHAGGRVG